jgi:predicted transposase/invertase (TIGR01784 family)
MCLAVEPDIGERAREVLAQARSQGDLFYERVLEIVEKTLLQRFPDLSQEELLVMMDIQLNDWRNSRIYREVKDEGKSEGKSEGKLEGKLEAVPGLLALGLTIPKIAEVLGLSVEQVQSQVSPSP